MQLTRHICCALFVLYCIGGLFINMGYYVNNVFQTGFHKYRRCRGSGHRNLIPTVLSNRLSTRCPTPERGNGIVKSNLTFVPVFKNTLNLSLINCQSVRNKTNEVIDHIIDNNIDICALTETWLKPGDEDSPTIAQLTPTGYSFLHIPRISRGGGVGILVNSSLLTTVQPHFKSTSFESITVLIQAVSFSFRVVVLYRIPPSVKNGLLSSTFFSEFSDFLEELAISSGQLIIVGDLNIHWDNPSNTDTIKLCNLIDSFDLKQHINEPTHSHGHILDMLFTRNSDNFLLNSHVNSLISDHHAIHCQLLAAKPPPPVTKVHYRKLKRVDFTKFINDLKSSSLLSVSANNVNDLVTQYNTDLRNILTNHAPLKTKLVVERPLLPWITDDILEAKKKRKKYEKQWRKSRLHVHKEMYMCEKHRVQILIQDAKEKHYNRAINECEGDQAKLFKIAKSLLHPKCTASLPDHECIDDLVADFNLFFINKIAHIRDNLDSSSDIIDPDALPVYSGSKLTTFENVDESTIRKYIMSASSATCDLDPVPSKLIKSELLEILLPAITNIVNLSLSSSTFPDNFKHALIKPLLKKSNLDINILKNFRPISNLAFLSKLIEKVVAAQLQEHLETNNICEPFQSAYKTGHSTETALLRVQNDILCAIDRKCGVLLVLLDLSAAFDTVDHLTLLALLKSSVGIEDKALLWFRSYLTNRTQSVQIENSTSLPATVQFGVPQGSVLGPLLFCVYTLLLGNIIRKYCLSFHIYADDTQIYCSFQSNSQESAASSLMKLKNCIIEIQSWMTSFRLKMNEEKTEFIVIASPHYITSFQNFTLNLGNTIVLSSESIRNLGVYFDKKLDMTYHINNICKIAFCQLRKIGEIRKYLNHDTAAKLIHAFVTSRIDYCNSLLCGLPFSKISKLQKAQNVAARILTKTKKYNHITPVFITLHWLPISLRIRYKVLLLAFKALRGIGPSYLHELLMPYNPIRSLRSQHQHFLLPVRSNLVTYGDRAFSVITPNLWNNLPFNLRACETLSVFKSGLKTHLFACFIDHPKCFL